MLGDKNLAEFQRFIAEVTGEPYSSAVLDLSARPYADKYRSGFKQFEVPSIHGGGTFMMERQEDKRDLVW